MTTKNKGARDCGPAPLNNASSPNNTPCDLLAKLGRAAWLAAYEAEAARQRYAGRQQLIREAGACMLLAILRIVGVR